MIYYTKLNFLSMIVGFSITTNSTFYFISDLGALGKRECNARA